MTRKYNLSKIELNNFRIYRGKKTIELATDDEKRITVIEGANGTGKTTLLNALTWCLYGVEYHLPPIAKDKWYKDLYNLQEVKESSNDKLEVSVELTFSDAQGPALRIKRKRQYIKLFNNEIEQDGEDQFIIMNRKGNDWKLERSDFISLFLPEALHNLFFFDGEQLDELFKTSKHKEDLHKSIKRLTQLDIVETTISHLNGLKSGIYKDIKDLSPSSGRTQQELSEIEKDIERLEHELEKVKKEKNNIEAEIERLDNELDEAKAERVKKLTEERKNLEADQKRIEEKINDLKSKSISHLIDDAPFIYCKDAIDQLNKQIEDMRTKGDLPPKIKVTFVKELLERRKCICGTDISPNSPQENALKQYVSNENKERLSQYIMENQLIINEIYDRINSFKNKRIEYGKEISEKEDEECDIKNRLKEISAQLLYSDIEEISRLEHERNKNKEKSKELYEKIGSITILLNQQKSKKHELEKELNKELQKERKYQDSLQQIKCCERAIRELDKIKEYIEKTIIDRLNQEVSEYFKELIWKKGLFERVNIDEDYNISVFDKDDNNILGILSAGEKEALALSFIAALRNTVDIKLPTVIDTPLARISSEVRINIANLLCEYLKDTQLILLVTDREYTDEVRQRLCPYVSKELKLEFDEQRQETRIIEKGK